MTRKPFEELTIADDFMFCKVMEDESLCKTFLELLLTSKVGKITYLSHLKMPLQLIRKQSPSVLMYW